MAMRALYWDGSAARVVDRPEPVAGPGTAVIRVKWAGICKTDLEICKGYMSFRGVLGHELVGTVTDGPDEWKGKRVVGEINFGCGACPECARGMQRHCPRRTVMGILDADGAFAEKIEVPVENLHVVPDGVSDEAAVFAEPLAAAFEILEQIHVHPGMECVVLGDGKLGLLVAQVLHLTGARVLAVGRHATSLAFLGKRGIATSLVDSWSKKKADLVVDATGSSAGFEAAVAATRPRGTLVLKSTVADKVPMNLAPLVIQEIRVVGSRCGSFAPALRALAAGSVDVTPLIGARVTLRDAERGLALAAKPGALKVLIDAG
ncbi:Threonine dehydrogenase [Minicystis rosea]|nr:Threonine dehydrogenase [Minicystis rosea]